MAKGFFRRQTKRIVIIANILAGILFLLGSYSYLFSPKNFWPVGLLNLTAFYFLLALIAFIIFWLFVKPRRALISAAAILLAYKPIKNILPFRLSNSFTKEKQAGDVRVMTWNVAQFNVLDDKKHPEVKNAMFDIINDYQPDIACFQEMVAEDSTIKNHGHMDEFLKNLTTRIIFTLTTVKRTIGVMPISASLFFHAIPLSIKKRSRIIQTIIILFSSISTL